jgi:hypothetical protein
MLLLKKYPKKRLFKTVLGFAAKLHLLDACNLQEVLTPEQVPGAEGGPC